MSTHALIGMQMPDAKQVRTIFLCCDGDYAEAGAILLAHYTSKAQVDALLDLGDLSVLRKELGQAHNGNWTWELSSERRTRLRLGEAKDDRFSWCISYARDLGEEECSCKPWVYANDQALIDEGFTYVYIAVPQDDESVKWYALKNAQRTELSELIPRLVAA